MRPLHRDAQQAEKQPTSHAGLWYECFFNKYDNACKVGDDGKTNWIKTITGSEVGDKKLLDGYAKRQQDLIKASGGITLDMSSQWHFVTGMGNNHPVENGFAWHHTLGVPYFTGAAVKGLVRAWCEAWEEDFDEQKIKQWFGDTDQSGELIFFDAIPATPVQLKADIMTPHYGDWYAKGDEDKKRDGSNVPADWHDPVPIPFLVVDSGQSFQFGIAKRPGSDIKLEDVSIALSNALQWLGAGAKTAAGYGRFSEDFNAKLKRKKQTVEMEKQDRAKREKLQAESEAASMGLTGLALELSVAIQQRGLRTDKSTWLREAPSWIERIQQHDNPEERQACKKMLIVLCEHHDQGVTVNPEKTKGKKKKPVYKPGVIQIVKTLLSVE